MTSGPLSPNFGSAAGAAEMADDAEAEVVLIAILAMPNELDRMPMAIALRKIDPFMMCSLDLLAV
jgi:hypothetical protein